MKWFYKLMLIITGARVFDLLTRSFDYLDHSDLGPVEIAGPSVTVWGLTGLFIAAVVILGLWKNSKLASWGCVTAGAYFTSLSLISLMHNWVIFPDDVRVSGSYAAIGVVWFVISVFWNGYAAVQDDRAGRG